MSMSRRNISLTSELGEKNAAQVSGRIGRLTRQILCVQAWTQEYLLQHWENTPFLAVNSRNEQ
jgi:hypothetical protein